MTAYLPLAGVRVVEFATIGPVPFAGLLLAQLGATVTRIEPPQPRDLGVPVAAAGDIGTWQREALRADLKDPAGLARAREAIADADMLIEGFRPGVMERLGLGPAECHGLQPRLLYGRLTGWGQSGPWAAKAGHDINYISMTGALASIGPKDGAPVAPLNLLGDMAGGALYLVVGLLAALHECKTSGRGVVVDAGMLDGCLHMLSAIHGRLGQGAWQDGRESNVIDSGVPWYGVYETADGGYMAVGAIEERFYAEFLERLGLDPAALPPRDERAQWPVLRRAFADAFRARPRAYWEGRFELSDACVTPVLDLQEAARHPLNIARGCMERDPSRPRTAPRFVVPVRRS